MDFGSFLVGVFFGLLSYKGIKLLYQRIQKRSIDNSRARIKLIRSLKADQIENFITHSGRT